MCTDDSKALEYKFNSAYYLAQKERLFTDFPERLTQLQEKKVSKISVKLTLQITLEQNSQIILRKLLEDSLNTDIANVNYYACLSDGSIDLSVIEPDVAYLLFLCEGTSAVKYFSVKLFRMADTIGIIDSIETVFNRFGITSFTDRMSA